MGLFNATVSLKCRNRSERRGEKGGKGKERERRGAPVSVPYWIRIQWPSGTGSMNLKNKNLLMLKTAKILGQLEDNS